MRVTSAPFIFRLIGPRPLLGAAKHRDTNETAEIELIGRDQRCLGAIRLAGVGIVDCAILPDIATGKLETLNYLQAD